VIIIDGETWNQSENNLLHEYTHYYLDLNSAGVRLPLWYAEGSAELFSTVKVLFGRIQLGLAVNERYWDARSSWIPLRELMTATRQSPVYVNQSTAFYRNHGR